MEKKIYKFKCGYVGISKIVMSKNVCPKCGSGIIGGVFTCEDCGKQFVSGRTKYGACRCPECYDIFDKVRKKAYDKKYRNRKRVDIVDRPMTFAATPPAPSARTDCKFYNHCLKFSLKENQNACKRCKLYVSATNYIIRGCGANHRFREVV